MEDNQNTVQWWPVAFLFGFLVLLAVLVFVVARPPGQPAEPGQQPVSAQEQARLSAEEFAELLLQRQPRYSTFQSACPIDGTVLEVPKQDDDNRLGGVATDLMKIALGPPEGGIGRPDFEAQDWEMLLVTNPNNGATYHGIDLYNIASSTRYEIADWDLAAWMPALAARPVDDWTVEERVLARVLTQRAAGVENVELGFSTLQGAYAANFNTWYGRKVSIPSPAFYALAAAYFRSALANDETLTAATRSVTQMTLGEMYRLLGRLEEAAQALAAAREAGGLDQYTLQVLAQLESLVAAGDSSLIRAEVAELAPLSTGWYLDEMLPAMNGHITAHRGEWNGLYTPEEVLARIDAWLAAD